jgi:predicted ribosome quality control (RQC) complex YloA/Tae2 family protein
MLSLTELQRAAHILDRTLQGTYLQRTAQIDAHRLALLFHSTTLDVPVLLSCRPGFARAGSPLEFPRAPAAQPSFGQFMRAHVSRARFREASVADEDRLLRIRLESHEGIFDLVLSILGARSNVYLVDGQGTLLHCMRPLSATRKELTVGQPWLATAGRITARGDDRWREVPDSDFLREIEITYSRLERRKEAEDIERRIDNVLTREETLLDRKAVNLAEDLGEAHKAADYGHKGEMLKGVLHLVLEGDTSVTATDFETGETVTIPLDPALSPAENLQAYFGRYQKELRGVPAIEAQLDATRAARAEIDALRARLASAVAGEEQDPELLRDLLEQPRIRRLLRQYYPSHRQAKPAAVPGQRKELPGRLQPRRFRTSDGLEIWVGRSDEGNDFLTTRLARGNDLFFHLEGYPGSHVILRTEGRPDPPSTSVLEACELAVHFSRLKAAGRADVHVAPVKSVRKPRGAKPGLVYVTGGKTVHIRRDPKRLENVLASRIDE